MNIVNLYENYNNYFNADLKNIFKLCSKTAAANGFKIYLIGGIVRDLLLNRENLDIDITIKGDAIGFARLLEKEGVAVISSIHEDFGTAKVQIQGQKIDLASTRSEIYKKAGHLPLVAQIGCSLEKDVLRRDFTINSLALSLNPDNFADLIDYVGGLDDLKSKKLRILHNKSFIDDPTRIIRGLKYATRLSFELEKETFELQKAYLQKVNYDMCLKRVKNELQLTLGLNSDECFNRFITQKIYKLIGKKDIESPPIGIEGLVKKYKPSDAWLIYSGIILLQEDNLDILLDNLQFTKKEKNIILSAKTLLNVKEKEAFLSDDFEIYKTLEGLDIETILLFLAASGEQKVLRYLDFLRDIKLSISGEDLLAIGVAPSKTFKDAFDYVLKIKLQNPQLKKEEEQKFLIEYIKSVNL